jgi:hypothetical protein
MRSHGVPDFPDLNANGSVSLPSSINPRAPAFQAAQQTCASLRQGLGSPPPPITGAQQAEMIVEARCVREHGVPNFPAPAFGADGKGVRVELPSNWNIYVPAVERAKKACAHVGIAIPGAGV